MQAGRRWDVFCRVIDNHGDLGVAWRLCADLAARGETLRLWVDDPAALAWMAPRGQPGVEVVAWTDPAPDHGPGDVVVEAFGCDPPPRFVERMAAMPRPPAWINLEYLSAETYVERCHGLPSPATGAARGLVKRFFYPGFTPATGGLLREPGLLERQRGFDARAWLAARGIAVAAGERVASLFCYADAPLAKLLGALADRPTLVLAAPGPAAAQLQTLLGAQDRDGSLRAIALSWLPQVEFDALLWSCDLNVVRGEDSFVRAQWAARPFLWQAYPQADGAHAQKIDAFLDRLLAGAEPSLASAVRAAFRGWNALAPMPGSLPEADAWLALCLAWRDQLATMPDLATQLLGFLPKTR